MFHTLRQRFRIFQAMLALRTFTVAELAKASGVPAQTIRNTLDRLRKLPIDVIEPVSREPTGKRGGAWIRYSVQPAGIEWLRGEASKLEPLVTPPADLLAAEELLLDDLAGEADPALRRRIRARAERYLENSRETIRLARRPHPEATAHAHAAALLLRLAELEDSVGGVGAWRPLAKELVEAGPELREVEQPGFYDALRERVWGSPIADRSLSEDDLLVPDHESNESWLGELVEQVSENFTLKRGWAAIPTLRGLAARLLELPAALGLDLFIGVSAIRGGAVLMEGLPPGVEAAELHYGDRTIVVAAGSPGSLRLKPVDGYQYLTDQFSTGNMVSKSKVRNFGVLETFLSEERYSFVSANDRLELPVARVAAKHTTAVQTLKRVGEEPERLAYLSGELFGVGSGG